MKVSIAILILASPVLAQDILRTVGTVRCDVSSLASTSIQINSLTAKLRDEAIVRPLTRHEFFYHLDVLTNSLAFGSDASLAESAAFLGLVSLIPSRQEGGKLEDGGVQPTQVEWGKLKLLMRSAHIEASATWEHLWEAYRLRAMNRGEVPRTQEVWLVRKSKPQSKSFSYELVEEDRTSELIQSGYLKVSLDPVILSTPTNQISRNILYCVSQLSLSLDGLTSTVLKVESLESGKSCQVEFVKPGGPVLDLSSRVEDAIWEPAISLGAKRTLRGRVKREFLDQALLTIYTNLRP